MFADALVRGVKAHQPKIDELIARFAEHWELDRMAVVDRNLLRAGIWELLWGADVPPKVAINEALEIARRFSTEESTRFVTGSSTGCGGSSARRVAPSTAGGERRPRRGGRRAAGRARAATRRRGGRRLCHAPGVSPAGLGSPGVGRSRAGAGPGGHGRHARRAFLEGWVAGLALYVPLLRWLTHTMTTFSQMTMPVAVLVLLALAGYLALFWGGVAWALAWLRGRLGTGALWLAPVLWVAGELGRTYLLGGFPWGLLGYVPSRRLLVIRSRRGPVCTVCPPSWCWSTPRSRGPRSKGAGGRPGSPSRERRWPARSWWGMRISRRWTRPRCGSPWCRGTSRRP